MMIWHLCYSSLGSYSCLYSMLWKSCSKVYPEMNYHHLMNLECLDLLDAYSFDQVHLSSSLLSFQRDLINNFNSSILFLIIILSASLIKEFRSKATFCSVDDFRIIQPLTRSHLLNLCSLYSPKYYRYFLRIIIDSSSTGSEISWVCYVKEAEPFDQTYL